MRFRGWLFWFSALCIGISLQSAPKPGQGDGGAYKVLVFGDLHYDAGEFHHSPPPTVNRKKERERNFKMWRAKSPALIAAAGRRGRAEHVAFAVQLGDMMQGDCDDAELQQAMIRAAFAVLKKHFPGIPLLPVKGNHDIRVLKNSRNNAAANAALLPIISDELGKKVTGNSCYSFRRGRDLYIAIDGFVDAKATCAFVKRTLDANPDTRYVFFMTHLPLMPTSTGAFWLVPGYDRIVRMLAERNSLVLAAHTHKPTLSTLTMKNDAKVTQLIVSSMGHSWNIKRGVRGYQSWEQYAAAFEKELPAARKSKKLRRQWREWNSCGTSTLRQLFRNTGFVILEVNDEHVVARYYINAANKPGETIELLVNR